MKHFATDFGTSKGQFYTLAEVSRVIAQIIGIHDGPTTSHGDPTCGSGSLLLKAADQATHGLTIYGQQKDADTWALARMNMILHGYATADLRRAAKILFRAPRSSRPEISYGSDRGAKPNREIGQNLREPSPPARSIERRSPIPGILTDRGG